MIVSPALRPLPSQPPRVHEPLDALALVREQLLAEPARQPIKFMRSNHLSAFELLRSRSSSCNSAVLEAIGTEVLGLGIRRRRYIFRPPPWQALTLGESIAHYFPDDHPVIAARLTARSSDV